ncbi:MAG: endonuclease domain-containing protein [Chloroflexota bacterium]|nr:endonuclease domain-containing protein [Chloroflexota bacterium]
MTRERIAIPVGLHGRMVEVARDFRKAPTPSERTLGNALRRDQLGVSFRRQHPIGPFVVDFFCASHRLIVEVDGPVHLNQQERDAERQTLLEACGYRVLRFTAGDVEYDLPQVLAAITTHLLA